MIPSLLCGYSWCEDTRTGDGHKYVSSKFYTIYSGPFCFFFYFFIPIILSFHHLYLSPLVWTCLFETNLALNFQFVLRFVLSFWRYISLPFFLSVVLVSFWFHFCFLDSSLPLSALAAFVPLSVLSLHIFDFPQGKTARRGKSSLSQGFSSFSSIPRIKHCPSQGNEELKVLSTDKRARRLCYPWRTVFFFFSPFPLWICLCKFLSFISGIRKALIHITFVAAALGSCSICFVVTALESLTDFSWLKVEEGTNIKQSFGTVSLAQTFLTHSRLEWQPVTLHSSNQHSSRQLYKCVQSSATAQNLIILN